MKKVLCTLLLVLYAGILAGCSGGNSSAELKQLKEENVALKKENEELKSANEGLKSDIEKLSMTNGSDEQNQENEQEFNIDKLTFNLEIVPSSNWVKISGTYTNGTSYTITDIIITYVDEMTNNIEYFGSRDTVLPGETSPVSSGDTLIIWMQKWKL